MDTDWLAHTPIAHRGLHDAATPENSLAAFHRAAEHSWGVELDVHVTADRRLAVMHDDDTLRTTGHAASIAASPWPELAELHLGGTSETVPSLDGVLAALPTETPVLVEIKPGTRPDVVGPLVVRALEARPERVAVQSFDPRIVAWFARHATGIPRGQLSGSFADVAMPAVRRLALRSMATNVVARPHFLAYEVAALRDWPVQLWRRALGVPLLAWTVRTPDDLATARAAGANVIFESVEP
jgi:glycerophosphoryl diester phosphodiesterase